MKMSHILLGLTLVGFSCSGLAVVKHHRYEHKVHHTVMSAKIDINKAGEKQLVTLKGLGHKKAKAVVEYRQQHGNFKTLAELAKVHGISQATVARLVKLNPQRLLIEKS